MRKQQGSTEAPLSLFISYAHEDEPLRQQLETHLSLLRRQGLIADWHDRHILAGDEWAHDIDQHLESASIILLLISPDFLASDYCYDTEMKRALERHQCGKARVIPIILRPCDWRTSPFVHLQCLPRDGKAITTWENQDEAFLSLAQGLRRAIERQQVPLHPLPEVERKNRASLIKRVRVTWIEGLLEHSLHEAARLELHLQERPDVLANPWRLQVQELDRLPQPLPPGTSIVQVYDEADGELLVLGEPGAGKTTLLLELTRTLLERAETDERHHIPVVFNLSSWAQTRQPLATWLVEELWAKYQVPRKVGQAWIDSDQVLPLLDGLDEVEEEARPSCVHAINTYYRYQLEKGLTPLMVVCCRNQEYMAMSSRVTLRQAVDIQPLTDEQVEYYLQSTGGQLEALQHALHNDPELYELAHRPLMLSIFTLAYQGAALQDLPKEGTPEVQQRQVFATYVERMLTRRGASRHGSREQIQHWLTFIALGMQQRHQTAFFLEYLEPDWLADSLHRRILYRLSTWLVAILVLDLFVGLDGWLLVGLVFGPLGWLLVGLVFGLLSRLLVRTKRQIQSREALTWSGKNAKWMIALGLVVGLGNGLVIWLDNGLVVGLVGGLVGALGGWLLSWLFVRTKHQIQSREALTWSGKNAKWMIVLGLAFGLASGFVSGLDNWLISGLSVGLVGGLLTGLGRGISTNQLDERTRLTPNQGIWGSARKGLALGALSGLVCGLVCGLLLVVFSRPSSPLVFGWFVWPLVAWFVAWFVGLGSFFIHFTLRVWLWRTDGLPWDTVAFLDEAAERLLLHKVGGGYIFIHRLLLDYFADLDAHPSLPSTAEPSTPSSTP